MQKITPFIWFNNQAEEAAKFYTSVFPNAKMGAVVYYPEGMPVPKGTVMTVTLQLEGQEFVLLNGGPNHQLTPAVSFVIACDTQEEIDHYWDKLVEGGKPQQCGWLSDQFGVTWQIVPSDIGSIAKSGKAMQAMMPMVKLDLATLRAARDSEKA